MTTTKTRTTRRVAATAAVATALAGMALLTAAPAQAGQHCTVIPHQAPIFEHDRPESRVVAQIDAGAMVGASRPSEWAMYRVSRADNGLLLGYMKPSHLHCDAG